MSQGDKWRLPDGREAIETSSGAGMLALVVILPDWPFPGPPMVVERKRCTRLPSRYLQGGTPIDLPEAPY
jgi:hypothetical protein